jgi:hypothetical protein
MKNLLVDLVKLAKGSKNVGKKVVKHYGKFTVSTYR